MNWLVGEPFGSGFDRTVEGSEVDVPPAQLLHLDDDQERVWEG